ncbi:uncharacterized protein LOC132751243 [Ruditapes philippinarum]|uniref:uncharacterized protein LOC132751243 n=1 Tax=Ruditapes philippinarum TaxID=129788 RepID=UPI00295B7ABE|nr:uncharacterized protein LOC132751243 [Ruditapes philippinarum]
MDVDQIEEIVDTLSTKLEAMVDKKIQDILGKDKTDTNASQNLPVLELPQPEMPNSTSNSDHQHGHIDRQVQAAGHIQQAKSNKNKPTASTTDILQGVENLLNASLAPSTLETYKRSWTLFQTFTNSYFEAPLSLPISVSVIALFMQVNHLCQ